MSRHTSSRLQGVGVRSNVTKESLLGRRVFIPLSVPLKSINVFPYSLIANNKTHFSVLYQFLLFHMSLVSCSLFKIVYSHVLKNLLVGLRKVGRLISRTCTNISNMYIGGYSASAGWSLAGVICERSHILLVGKNCSRTSNCQADLVYVVWESCCIAVLHTHTHGIELFSLN